MLIPFFPLLAALQLVGDAGPTVACRGRSVEIYFPILRR